MYNRLIFEISTLRVSPATSKTTTSKIHQPDFSIRARRLMKEYKEIQKEHNSKKDPIFTVKNYFCFNHVCTYL